MRPLLWIPLAAFAGAIAAVWYLPQWAALPSVALLALGAGFLALTQRRREAHHETWLRHSLGIPLHHPERMGRKPGWREKRHLRRWCRETWPEGDWLGQAMPEKYGQPGDRGQP